MRAILCGIFLCAMAGSAHAQNPPPPVVQIAAAGINNANIISCLPGNTVGLGRGSTCSFTILTPNVVDLSCVFFTNFKTLATVPTTAGASCTPATPNTVMTLTFNNPNLGEGSIIGSFTGQRTGGTFTQSSGFVQIPDASFVRFFQLSICPVRSLTVPFDDPLCPVNQNGVANDVQAFEFPNQ